MAFRDQGPDAYLADLLGISEINADERIVAAIAFDLDDVDAAFEELNARYLAGEAAAHSHTWSVITGAYGVFNRHELPALTANSVYVDHRSVVTVAAVDLTEFVRVSSDLIPDLCIYIDAVHSLSGLGTVVTHTARGISQGDFDAEWRNVVMFTVDGDLISRCEVFDEADLDAAIAKFKELHRQARPPENAASQVYERYCRYFAARDWAAVAEQLTADTHVIDHRRAVNSGARRGRDLEIANMQAVASVGVDNITSEVVATRGINLALCCTCMWGQGKPEAFRIEFLSVVETNADERIVARVAFDPDDIDAAFAELDARYLAGEAAAYSRTWSVIAGACAAFNRHELAPTTTDSIYIDHRPVVAVEAVDLDEFTRATWKTTPNASIYIEAVHNLNNLGAVVTQTARGSSHDGFDAEWRLVDIYTVDGDLISRNELFDEADLEAALARFDELHPQAPRLETAASQLIERFQACFAARDWAAMAELMADDISTDDRRRVVNAGNQHGRDFDIANMRALADLGVTNIASVIIATRGERLSLSRSRMSGRDQRPEAFRTEALSILEIDADNRAAARVVFDLEDIDAAFEELDARYLAGEAAAHAHTWSVIAQSCAAFNRHELPAADWVTIDHRQLAPIDASDLQAAMRAVWDLTPDLRTYIEAVHRLSSFGAVVTYMAYGTSREGFDAEWRMVDLLTVEGDRIDRYEIFDEVDLDAALARFEELHAPTRRLENAASQLWERFQACLAAEDWAAMAAMTAEDGITDDRRRVIGAGIHRGRDVHLANIRATLEVGIENVTSPVVAIRGQRLVLDRVRFSGHDLAPEPFNSEMLRVLEIDAEQRFTAAVFFDPDDIDAAFAELDARYLAGEAAAHSHTWSVLSGMYAAINRHELPATTPDCPHIDHRSLMTTAPIDLPAVMRAVWDITPDVSIYVDTVHRLSDLGALVTSTARGISPEGFDAEWRMILIYTFEGELLDRNEIFDEADLDAALARFDELDRPAPP
jgi:hypothetical protein